VIDRFNDLQKQGFMKARKPKRVTIYRVWDNDARIGEFVCCATENKQTAELALMRTSGGRIEEARELR
jgi:hypothetical protein